MAISIDLPSGVEQQLSQKASELNVLVEQFAGALLRDLVAQPEAEFDRAATRVLEKNRELYRRLA